MPKTKTLRLLPENPYERLNRNLRCSLISFPIVDFSFPRVSAMADLVEPFLIPVSIIMRSSLVRCFPELDFFIIVTSKLEPARYYPIFREICKTKLQMEVPARQTSTSRPLKWKLKWKLTFHFTFLTFSLSTY